MKHVFIGPDAVSISVLYQGFQQGENTELILLDSRIRRAAKALTLLHVTRVKAADFIFQPYFDHVVGVPIAEKKWKDTVCFIVYARIYESFGMALVRYLRKRFSGCKIVAYLGDIVPRFKFDIEELKEVFDRVLCFDTREAGKYGLVWCPVPFSSDIVENMDSGKRTARWDVVFVGAAKNRYHKIIELYEILKKAGLTCDFHITGVKPWDRKYIHEIGYKYMDYMTLLEHVRDSRCIAEILQDGGTSPTTRFSEAMLSGKNLLTNCKCFKNEADRPAGVFYFDSVLELRDWNLEKLKEPSPVETARYKKFLSIEEMIKTVDSALDCQENSRCLYC